jgi:hypothetical protein
LFFISPPTIDWNSSKNAAVCFKTIYIARTHFCFTILPCFLQLLVYHEFFSQGDLEKKMGNRPDEMMDREKACIPTLQIQFIDDVALPVYS